MSQYMEGLKLGDTMDFRGPTGMIEYKAGAGNDLLQSLVGKSTAPANKFDIRKFNKLGMIAGGTGITPMLQVMRAIKKDWLKDPTRKLLVHCCYPLTSPLKVLKNGFLSGA
ncbi:hypothetical protein CYMTET_36381 [Cymbomonas tetramitiformis]|uniref:Oxidoreductase FAD/NAD(P)-binding domain-containing protein n=1 Tax=Cymbomonas tetramitiformis TaxID=36881 RepID=A0AAE0CHC0_9CHLO|nr:hypothetical protein CYMTET_54100 [Cymbomonas tetramitiformis]KAK3254403.1 hypothetical protein CYMTET_36381 [Cymbomonas tetramitiformis]